jgi:hypothetical protein
MQVDPGNYLRVMTASTGTMQKAIPGLAMTPRKTLLSPSGSYAYVMASNGGDYKGALVAVVDLTSDAVVAYIQVAGGLPFDIRAALRVLPAGDGDCALGKRGRAFHRIEHRHRVLHFEHVHQ